MTIKRGDIYIANLPKTSGSVQHGKRPVLIIQNDVGNLHSPTVIIAPLTTRRWWRKARLPTHVPINLSKKLRRSVVMFEQVQTIDKSCLAGKVAHTAITEQMEAAIRLSLGMEFP